jgi:hypothetical protein
MDPAEFWRQTSEKRGGEISFRTFAAFLGRSGEKLLGLPGLLFIVGDTVWFEDFERENWLSKIVSANREFKKTELSFAKSEVTFVRAVSRGSAYRCIAGRVPPDKLPLLTPRGRLFLSVAVQVGLRDGPSLFFEVINREPFLEMFDRG